MLVHLRAGGEEKDVGLERRLEGLVPVLQISQDGERLGGELVKSGRELVGNFAFVHKNGKLRVADGKLSPILDLAVLHRISIGKNPIAGLNPVNNVDELFGNKRSQAHSPLPTLWYVQMSALVASYGVD